MNTDSNTAQKRAQPAKVVLASDLFREAFERVRAPKSEAYRMGVSALLRYRMLESERCVNPFTAGTAERDAWDAGLTEGWSIIQKNRCDLRMADRAVCQVPHDVAQNNFPRG